MPRRTRKRLVGKQEDIEREEREAALRDLAWELHLAWAIGEEKFSYDDVEPTDQTESRDQAKTMLLTVHVGTATRQK